MYKKFLLATFLFLLIQLNVSAFDYNNYTNCIVLVSTLHKDSVSMGNGFFVDSGLVLTNKHIIEREKGDFIVVRTSDNEYLIGHEVKEYKDLALVKIGKKTSFLYLNNKFNKKESVHIVSYFNNNYLDQDGNVLDIKRTKWDKYEYKKTLALSNYATFGYSGSPLLNDNGEVIGIVSAVTQLNMPLLDKKISVFFNSYAISTDDIINFLQR